MTTASPSKRGPTLRAGIYAGHEVRHTDRGLRFVVRFRLFDGQVVERAYPVERAIGPHLLAKSRTSKIRVEARRLGLDIPPDEMVIHKGNLIAALRAEPVLLLVEHFSRQGWVCTDLEGDWSHRSGHEQAMREVEQLKAGDAFGQRASATLDRLQKSKTRTQRLEVRDLPRPSREELLAMRHGDIPVGWVGVAYCERGCGDVRVPPSINGMVLVTCGWCFAGPSRTEDRGDRVSGRHKVSAGGAA